MNYEPFILGYYEIDIHENVMTIVAGVIDALKMDFQISVALFIAPNISSKGKVEPL